MKELSQAEVQELGHIIADMYEYDSFDDYLEASDSEDMATGICYNPDCHVITEEYVEPDATENWCAVCNNNTVISVTELMLRMA